VSRVTSTVSSVVGRVRDFSRAAAGGESMSGSTVPRVLRTPIPVRDAAPTAAMMRMLTRQEVSWPSHRPSGTPKTVPVANPASTRPSARPRDSAGTDAAATAVARGEYTPAAAPAMTRAMRNTAIPGATAVNRFPRVKTSSAMPSPRPA
jgi:hypothetical protein